MLGNIFAGSEIFPGCNEAWRGSRSPAIHHALNQDSRDPDEGVKGGTAIRENMALYLNLCLTSRHKGQFDDTGKPDIIFEPILALGRGI